MANYLIAALLSVGVLGCAQAKAGPVTAVEHEITFTGAGGMRLVGTMTLPVGQSSAPALLLLPGSGPTDRDGNSGLGIRTDVLKRISDHLASKGWASFRFDKRAIKHYSDSWPKDPDGMNRFFSYNNFIEDAKAAYRAMRKEPGIDAKRTGILGHSEGGLFALQLASDLEGSPEAPTRLVLLATCGRQMDAVIHDQLQLRTSAPGVPKELADQLLGYSDAACAALKAGKPLPPNEPDQLRALYNPTVLDIMTAYVRTDPAELLKHYNGPVLIVNGSDDTQVSPTRDAPRLDAACHGRHRMLIVNQASHNLKSTAGGNKDAFEGPVMPAVFAGLDEFLK